MSVFGVALCINISQSGIQINNCDFTKHIKLSNQSISIIALENQFLTVLKLNDVSIFQLNRRNYHSLILPNFQTLYKCENFWNFSAKFSQSVAFHSSLTARLQMLSRTWKQTTKNWFSRKNQVVPHLNKNKLSTWHHLQLTLRVPVQASVRCLS